MDIGATSRHCAERFTESAGGVVSDDLSDRLSTLQLLLPLTPLSRQRLLKAADRQTESEKLFVGVGVGGEGGDSNGLVVSHAVFSLLAHLL